MIALTGTYTRLQQAISGQRLFYAMLLLLLGLALAFCLSVYSTAKRADARLVQTVEAQMLRVLEQSGVSGLAAASDTSGRIVLPGTDRLELALWQKRGASRYLVLETLPGVAEAFGSDASRAVVEGIPFRLHDVDIASASVNWALPMQDAVLIFGIAEPSFEMQLAGRLIRTIIAAALCVGAVMLMLQLLHWQRYRGGVQRINALLDRYSGGETGVRFEDENPAPELRELARQLNVALPRLDALFADLRALSAHLAHELRTPLQTIRGGVRKIVRAENSADRADLARRINEGIDGADARLQTVMQLFRLQADAEVSFEPNIPLGDVLEDLAYDFEADLTDAGRALELAIDKSVMVQGSQHLLELMISNLLSNAAKYAPPDTQISIILTAQHGDFDLMVRNAGTLPDGLSAFDRYAQADGNRGITGFGLGLGLVRAIAQKHGFAAQLYSEPAGAASEVVARVTGECEVDSDA